MPCLKNAAAEARRVDAVRAALLLHRPWASSTGPTSQAGKRRVSGNGFKHGLESLAVIFAGRYCMAVERALKGAGVAPKCD